MELTVEYGDVTKKYPEYVQAHCISVDCVMGSGVVIAYRNMFPGLKAACLNYVAETPATGCMPNGYPAPYRHVDDGKVLYNMFTKRSVWHNAHSAMTYQEYLSNLKMALEYVHAGMIANEEHRLAISKIGCGRDGCQWEDVKNILFEVFGDTDIEILVCEYDENAENAKKA